jgi:hypothetical protein
LTPHHLHLLLLALPQELLHHPWLPPSPSSPYLPLHPSYPLYLLLLLLLLASHLTLVLLASYLWLLLPLLLPVLLLPLVQEPCHQLLVLPCHLPQGMKLLELHPVWSSGKNTKQ